MQKDLRIIFMGTPEFAIPSLKILLEHNYQVVAVITALDKPRGRGRVLTPSPVKAFAMEKDIPVLQPPNLKDPGFIKELAAYNANLQVVVAFRMLPEVVWAMPEYGTINLHASLLPAYRGAAPINWVLINGEKTTGLTTFFIRQEIDTGNILFREKLEIDPEDNAGTLHDKMMELGGDLVLRTVRAIESGNYQTIQQTDAPDLKKAPKIFREDCEIDWNTSCQAIRNFIRGLTPFPGARTVINGKIYKISKVEIVSNKNVTDTIGEYTTDSRSYLHFRCSDGIVSIVELQPEGKRKMHVEDFFRGNKL